MARKDIQHVCDCGRPYKLKDGQDPRRKCDSCVKKFPSEYLGGKCVDCGQDHIATLDFDHKPDQKKCFKISGNYMLLWRYLKKELDKCVIRCSNCHRIRHYQENINVT